MGGITKTIRLSAHLRQVAGAKAVTVAVEPGATVQTLFQMLSGTNPALVDHIVDAQGDLKPGIQFLVDGRHIDFLQGMATTIDNANDLFLIPPVFGG